jgi:dolichol-phosphate mannosyltransferase
MANEGATAVAFVCDVLAQCEAAGFRAVTMFCVVDEVSRDDTFEQLRRLECDRRELRVVWAPENRTVVDAYVRGYNAALAAACDWILEIDAGYSHQPSDLPKFFARMKEGYACVFGSRFCPGGRIVNSSSRRWVLSRGGSLLANAVLGTRLTDMTGGFELFSRPVLERVLRKGIRSRGPFFQTEIKAYCRSVRVVEVPIEYRAASHRIDAAMLADAVLNLGRLTMLRLTHRL